MGQTEIKEGIVNGEKTFINYFELKYVIGRGGFGKVWKVVCKKNNKEYAMKIMSKLKIIHKKSVNSVISEKNLLSKFHHPFLVNMNCTFQDEDNLYLVMDLLTGGDLRYHIGINKQFSHDQTKFFIACMLLGLKYIHSNNVIHRDIKPENLVLEENGYLRITDFGIAKVQKKINKQETSGTPGYMAPEVLNGQNHTFSVDFFAIGVIGYEFMRGHRPYHGKTRADYKQDVFSKQVGVGIVPDDWQSESADFISNCLQRKSEKRLGAINGVEELQNHPWFEGFNWDELYNKKLQSPFVPKRGDNYNKKYCEAVEKLGPTTEEKYREYKENEDFPSLFFGYTFANAYAIEEVLCVGNVSTGANGNISSMSTVNSGVVKKDKNVNKDKDNINGIMNNSVDKEKEKDSKKENKDKDKEKDKEKEKEKNKEEKEIIKILMKDKEKIDSNQPNKNKSSVNLIKINNNNSNDKRINQNDKHDKSESREASKDIPSNNRVNNKNQLKISRSKKNLNEKENTQLLCNSNINNNNIINISSTILSKNNYNSQNQNNVNNSQLDNLLKSTNNNNNIINSNAIINNLNHQSKNNPELISSDSHSKVVSYISSSQMIKNNCSKKLFLKQSLSSNNINNFNNNLNDNNLNSINKVLFPINNNNNDSNIIKLCVDKAEQQSPNSNKVRNKPSSRARRMSNKKHPETNIIDNPININQNIKDKSNSSNNMNISILSNNTSNSKFNRIKFYNESAVNYYKNKDNNLNLNLNLQNNISSINNINNLSMNATKKMKQSGSLPLINLLNNNSTNFSNTKIKFGEKNRRRTGSKYMFHLKKSESNNTIHNSNLYIPYYGACSNKKTFNANLYEGIGGIGKEKINFGSGVKEKGKRKVGKNYSSKNFDVKFRTQMKN